MISASIIIPAYNEEEGIKDVLKNLQETLHGKFNYEIIVVDDGSTDKTSEIAESLGVRVITNAINAGYGASLKKGIEAAKYEYVVTTDADGTYPIKKIPELLTELDKGVDMVVGARMGKYYWTGLFLNPARLIFKWLSEFATGKKISDINSGLRAIRRSRALPFFPDLSNRFSFSTSITLVFMLKSYLVKYIPIDYFARKGKSKVHYIRDALRTLQIISIIIAKYNPLKLFLVTSLLAWAPFIVFLVLQQWIAALISFYFIILVVLLGFFASMFSK